MDSRDLSTRILQGCFIDFGPMVGLGRWYDCINASEVTPKTTGKMSRYKSQQNAKNTKRVYKSEDILHVMIYLQFVSGLGIISQSIFKVIVSRDVGIHEYTWLNQFKSYMWYKEVRFWQDDTD